MKINRKEKKISRDNGEETVKEEENQQRRGLIEKEKKKKRKREEEKKGKTESKRVRIKNEIENETWTS